jgi:hypothetical protein
MVQAVTTKPLDEVAVLIQDAVTAAGYRPAGMDNEGFEAEVFFTTGLYAAGQARVRRAACEGRWDSTSSSSTVMPSSRVRLPLPRSPNPSGGVGARAVSIGLVWSGRCDQLKANSGGRMTTTVAAHRAKTGR